MLPDASLFGEEKIIWRVVYTVIYVRITWLENKN